MPPLYRYRRLSLAEIAILALISLSFAKDWAGYPLHLFDPVTYARLKDYPNWIPHSIYHLLLDPLVMLLILGVWLAFYLAGRSRFILADGALFYRAPLRSRRMPLAQLTRAGFTTLPFISWVTLVTPTQTLRVFGILENYDEFLGDLWSQLARGGAGGCYDPIAFRSAWRWAVFFKQARERAQAYEIYTLVVVYYFVLELIGELVSRFTRSGFNGWDTLQPLYPLAVWALFEILVYETTARAFPARHSALPARSPQQERFLLRWTFAFATCVYLALVLAGAVMAMA